jgi:hypothetical protein
VSSSRPSTSLLLDRHVSLIFSRRYRQGVNITFQLVDMFELRGRSAARVPTGETSGSRVRSAPAPRLDGSGDGDGDGDGDGRVMGTEAGTGTGTGEGRGTVREAGAGSGTGTAGTEAAKAHVPPPASPAGAAFVHALASEDDAFERVYVAWFEVLYIPPKTPPTS